MSGLSPQGRGLLLTVSGVLLISPDGLLTRLIQVDSWTLIYWRGVWMGCGMSLLLLAIHRGATARVFIAMGMPGVIMTAIYCFSSIAFIYAITHTSVAATLLIFSTTPLFAALISRLFLGEVVGRRTWLAIGAAGLGVAIVISGDMAPGVAPVGTLAGVAGAILLAAGFTVVRGHRGRDLLPAVALGGFATAVLVLPLAALGTAAGAATPADMMWLFIMGFIMLPPATSLMFLGPKYIPAPSVGLLLLLETLLGPLWVWLALGENPGARTWIGGAVVLTTLVIYALFGLLRPVRGAP